METHDDQTRDFFSCLVVALSEKGSFRNNLVCVEIVVAGTTRGKEED